MTGRALGDFFPENVRRESAARQFTAGRVLYLTCNFTTPQKEKFVVVAAPDDPPLLLVVNSTINPFIEARPHLKGCQVALLQVEHGFLKHDSFLDCSQTFNSMSSTEIVEQLVADLRRVKGELSTAARGQAVEAIRRARTISPADKKRILASLT